MVSGGALRTTAPGASTTASSPCSMACRVATVLLNAMSMRPDCRTGTASAPLSNLVASISIPSALKNPCLSAMTAPSASEKGNRPTRSLVCATAAVESGASRTANAQSRRRMTTMAYFHFVWMQGPESLVTAS